MSEEKELEKMAENTGNITDTLVYRGFVDDKYDDDVKYDFDETPVMICPAGEWTGGSTDGKIVKQVIDDVALDRLAETAEEVLVDRDHGSMKTALDRDTRAYGWASGFRAVKNAGDFSGLYGVIKWSDKGKDLIKDRSYRFLSPAFELDSDGRPVKLISIGLTNRPNFKMAPIINSTPDENNVSIAEEIMTKEEIEALVAETVKAAVEKALAKPETEPVEEKTEAVDACAGEKEKTETVAEAPVEEKTEEKTE